MTKLTAEQKAKFAPMLRATWGAVAADCEEMLSKGRKSRVAEIIDITCDADHPVMYGRMSKEEYAILGAAMSNPDTKKWLREVLNY